MCYLDCRRPDSPARGIVDHRNRAFGYKNMYAVDGSVVSANLGVNPSLTITALAERAMGFIPRAEENAWDDCAESSQRIESALVLQTPSS